MAISAGPVWPGLETSLNYDQASLKQNVRFFKLLFSTRPVGNSYEQITLQMSELNVVGFFPIYQTRHYTYICPATKQTIFIFVI